MGEYVWDFWDSIGNVNEINTQLKNEKKKSKELCQNNLFDFTFPLQ